MIEKKLRDRRYESVQLSLQQSVGFFLYVNIEFVAVAQFPIHVHTNRKVMCEEWLYVVDAAYDDVDVRSEIFYNRNGDIFDLQVFVQLIPAESMHW